MAWVIDLDGVVRLGRRRITGAPEAIAALRAAGHRVVFATNNSNDTGAEVEAQLRSMGVPARGAVVTSAAAAAVLIEPGERVQVCGGPGVLEAVEARGATVVGPDDRADAVVVGFHRSFDYEAMTAAVRAVLDGARLVATNDDRTYPTPDGPAPGAGAILASVVAATDVAPVVAGKPHPPMATAIREHLATRYGASGDPTIVVGDRPDTDGALARALGVPFALVLSGITADEDLPGPDRPALVAPDLAAVVARLVPGQPVRARL